MREVIRIVFEDIYVGFDLVLHGEAIVIFISFNLYNTSLPYPDQTTKDHRVNLGLVHLLGA